MVLLPSRVSGVRAARLAGSIAGGAEIDDQPRRQASCRQRCGDNEQAAEQDE